MATKFAALASALTVALALGITANAATTTKPYTATWVSGDTVLANPLPVSAGSTTLTLRITNKADPQSLGSANIRPPDGYTLTGVRPLSLPATAALDTTTNTVRLRNLNLAPLVGIVDVIVDVTTACLADGVAKPWNLIVKQANNFSGPPGNDFVIQPADAYPSTVRAVGSACLLRFANQPNTTKTGQTIKDGVYPAGNAIKVEIYDPSTNLTVDSDADVTLDASVNPSGGTLTEGGPVPAVGGVATFTALSLDKAGAYKLHASSPAASDSPSSTSNQFMVADTIDTTCSGTDAGCTPTGGHPESTVTMTPKRVPTGTATYVASLNLSGLRISCDFSPFNYPDSRQPNGVWYFYDDGNFSVKTNKIVIDKAHVQATPENGSSAYRVCYTSPEPFLSRSVTGYALVAGVVTETSDGTGSYAPPDPWNTVVEGLVGPTVYFGETWYTGLLPDCKGKNPVAPCVLSWTGDSAGNRVGTFLTPPGDPSYR